MSASPRTQRAKCSCGATTFAVRLDPDQQVGLLTCARHAHHSLLLDSRDYWGDVIQDGRPKAQKCRCGGKQFAVDLVYTSRDGDVRSIDVELRCAGCKAERTATTFEIDYSPTTALVKRPLDPCPEPWLKAKQITLVGYWTERDVAAVVNQLEKLGATLYFAGPNERPAPRVARDIVRAVGGAGFYQLFFATREVRFLDDRRDCWKRLPVIRLGSPIQMNLPAGRGSLYYLEWASEVIRDGIVVPQDAAFLDLAKRVLAWMPTHFARRGARVFDNPAEARRLQR